MKKFGLCLILPALMLVTSCDGLFPSAVPTNFEGKVLDIYGLVDGKASLVGNISAAFKKDREMPYVSLKEGFNFLSTVRQEQVGNQRAKYTLTANKDNTVVENERGAKCTIDSAKKTVTYTDFDTFYAMSMDQNPLAITPESPRALKIDSSKSLYHAGNAYTVDLSQYESIEFVVNHENQIFMPLATFNDLFFSAKSNVSLVYNYNQLYLVPNVGLGTRANPTPLGKHYYEYSKKQASISEDLAKFNYEELMLNLNTSYGLKAKKNITSFEEFTKEDKALFTSRDPKEQDRALLRLTAASSLNDHHTVFTACSPFYSPSEFQPQQGDYSQESKDWEELDEKLTNMRKEAKATAPFEVIGDTAFIYFQSFAEMNEKLLYKSSYTQEEIAGNNAVLFAHAYKQITSNSAIKNVLIDMGNNDGGAADSCIYCLGVVLGEFFVESFDSFTNANGKVYYKVDINLDGVIDDKDIPLTKNYNVAILDSKCSFSCGNLFPVAAKNNNSKIAILGERSGGGACPVRSCATSIGSTYSLSSPWILAKTKDGKLVDIDDGVEADYPLAYEKYFDRQYLASYLSSDVFKK